jgi:hypothetical protein
LNPRELQPRPSFWSAAIRRGAKVQQSLYGKGTYIRMRLRCEYSRCETKWRGWLFTGLRQPDSVEKQQVPRLKSESSSLES